MLKQRLECYDRRTGITAFISTTASVRVDVQHTSSPNAELRIPSVQVAPDEFVFDVLKRSVLLPIRGVGIGSADHGVVQAPRRWNANGNSSYVRPSRVRPVWCLRTPPHCLKKNGTHCFRHSRRMRTTHSRSIGRAWGPLSPPTITQSMEARSTVPRSASSGSIERNRIDAGVSRSA